MCEGGNGGVLFFSNSFRPQNYCGLVLVLLTSCNGSGYGCPFYKGKKGCGSAEWETRLGPDGNGEPIANICCEGVLLMCQGEYVSLVLGLEWL
jgi:hypothetical protein